jgi:stage V sporulation protein G
MNITDVQIDLVESRNGDLRALCSIVFDNALVVHEVKVLEEPQGLFVVMPTQENGQHCVKCDEKNPIRANFCNRCGTRLPPGEPILDKNGHVKRRIDIAHPINRKYEKLIQHKVLNAYQDELKKAGQSN